MRTRILFFNLFWFIGICPAFSQQKYENLSFSQYEKLLKPLGKQMLNGLSDAKRDSAGATFLEIFRASINTTGSQDFRFDSIRNISRIATPKNDVVLYTWIVPHISQDTVYHYGFIQLIKKKGFLFRTTYSRVTELKDLSREIDDPENRKGSPEKWYGALYYKLISKKNFGKTYYALLGYKPGKRTQKKVIDNFTIQNDKIIFGQPIFKNDKLTKNRVVFEYSRSVAMTLKYEADIRIPDIDNPHPKKKKKRKIKKESLIVFDHIGPSSGLYEGQKEFYGPDGSYDAYKFIKGKWVFYSAVDVTNPKEPHRKYRTKRENGLLPPK